MQKICLTSESSNYFDSNHRNRTTILYKLVFKYLILGIVIALSSKSSYSQNCSHSTCDDLIINGNFNQGGTIAPATSNLINDCDCDPGRYCVTSTPINMCSNPYWQNIGDWNGGGNFMVIDGRNLNVIVWNQQVNLIANQQYTFIFHVLPNASQGFSSTSGTGSNNGPSFNIEIGGTVIGSVTPPYNAGLLNWNEVCVIFTPSISQAGSTTIRIRETGGTTGWNDYGLDGISLRANSTTPFVEFRPIELVNLCSIGENGMTLDATCNGPGTYTSWSISPNAPTNALSSGGVFYPYVAGPGYYDITFTCTNNCTSVTVIQQIQVYEFDTWHQSTSYASAPIDKGDQGNDVYTDEDGNVYSAGYFYRETTFDDDQGGVINLNVAVHKEKSAYIAKFNGCGALQWIIYDDWEVSHPENPNNSEGIGIKSVGNYLYAVLNYQDIIRLNTIYPGNVVGGIPLQHTGSGFQFSNNMLLLAINKNNGLIAASDNNHFNYTATALDATSDIGADHPIFVCGSSDINNNKKHQIFLLRTDYDLSGNFIPYWIQQTIQEDSVNVANDVKYDSELDRVLLTGTYTNEISLLDQGGNPFTINTNAKKDAFISVHNPKNGLLHYSTLWHFNINDQGYAEGTCLSSNDGNYLHYGGNFSGFSEAPFHQNTPFTSSQGLFQNSYVFTYRLSPGATGIDNIYCEESDVYLTGSDANDFKPMFVGYYGTGLLMNSPFNNISQDERIFLADINYMTNWQTVNIFNTTEVTGLSNLVNRHFSTRISLGQADWGYLTGTYLGQLNYYYGNPSSGALNSIPNNGSNYNAYLMRTNLSLGALNRQANPNNRDETEVLVSDVEINIYPSPTMGEFTVHINNLDIVDISIIQLVDVAGKVILEKSSINSNKLIFDLSKYAKGVYSIMIRTESNNWVERVVKY